MPDYYSHWFYFTCHTKYTLFKVIAKLFVQHVISINLLNVGVKIHQRYMDREWDGI